MIELLRDAPLDSTLLLLTVLYAIVAYRILRKSVRRDGDLAERMRVLLDELDASARQRTQARRASPAE